MNSERDNMISKGRKTRKYNKAKPEEYIQKESNIASIPGVKWSCLCSYLLKVCSFAALCVKKLKKQKSIFRIKRLLREVSAGILRNVIGQ